MTNNRTKTLWLPALVSLTGSMLWRFILQRSFPQSQPLLNHRAPARLPTSLACRIAASWRMERLFISPRRGRQIDRPHGGSVPLDRDDPGLASISDQDESPISPPVVWLALRRAELDWYAWYRSLIGRVASAEGPARQEHKGNVTH
jgi:hypothetical protein